MKVLWAFVPLLAFLAMGCQGEEAATTDADETAPVVVQEDGVVGQAEPAELQGSYVAYGRDLVTEEDLAEFEAEIRGLPEEMQAMAQAQLEEFRRTQDFRIIITLEDGQYTMSSPDEEGSEDQTGTYTYADGIVTIALGMNQARFQHDAVAGTLRPVEDPMAPLPETAVFRKQD